jgi:PAS domain S-box-containing protein
VPRAHVPLLQAILDETTDSVFVKDLEGRYLMINAAGARYVGRPAEDIIGKRDTELFPSETAHQITTHDRHVTDSGVTRSYEAVLPVDGSPRVFLSTKTPYRSLQGEVIGLIGISRDITERKQAEQALRESEERLARILESAMDAIITIDDHRIVHLFNSAAEDVFRCKATEARGQSFDRFASGPLREVLTRCLQAFGRTGVGKRYVWIPDGLTAVRADGEVFSIEATISRVEMARQRLFTIILRDVNDRKEAEEELRKLQLENLYLHEEAKTSLHIDEIVGDSEAIKKVFQSIQQVSRTDSTVLITGETGTGKELVALAIHARSARKERLLIKVNCAALPAGLVESELFGHEKGAFTGALSKKIGRFEMADQGTIFLDEIGDLSPELQVKLLRVLQEGEFERVGGIETLTTDVRVIAATNRNLEELIKENKFRQDLYYRLDVFPIDLPALRERSGDIPLLVRHFAMHYGRKMGKRVESIPQAVLDTLEHYHWPGNVRELQNVIERAVIVSERGALEIRGWPPARIHPDEGSTTLTLEELERRHILNVLELTGGRVSGENGAATVLGLKPTTLESRMKKLGIKRPS